MSMPDRHPDERNVPGSIPGERTPASGRLDFFVSFTATDRDWAEWIASELEAIGYRTFVQHWDSRPGGNFVLEMHQAAVLADHTIAVLSSDYLSALFTQPEWAAALVRDPTGVKRSLIPIRVRPCEPQGLLKPITYVDLVGLTEANARAKLRVEVGKDRLKPAFVAFPKHVGDYVEGRDIVLTPKLGRRALMRLLPFGLTGAGVVASVGWITGLSTKGLLSGACTEDRHEFLNHLFGIGDGTGVLIPAADHPFAPPNNGLWYPLDGACAVSYKTNLLPRANVRTIPRYPEPQAEDSLVLFGSQVSNLETRHLFGNPWQNVTPSFTVHPGQLGNGWEAHVRWNLYTRPSSTNFVRYKVPKYHTQMWEEEERGMLDSKTLRLYTPRRNRSHSRWLLEDYLLVTSLPRYVHDHKTRRILTFSGLYAPGMAAAQQLLASSSKTLRELVEKTEGGMFYQALYHVSVKSNQEGELRPTALSLVDAVQIKEVAAVGTTKRFSC